MKRNGKQIIPHTGNVLSLSLSRHLLDILILSQFRMYIEFMFSQVACELSPN